MRQGDRIGKVEVESDMSEEAEQYYGAAYPVLKQIRNRLLEQIKEIEGELADHRDRSPIEHNKARIKAPDSMQEKLIRKQITPSLKSALCKNHDAVGARVVCTFVKDVYQVANRLEEKNQVVEVKDYIKKPKGNGYRSLHMILRFPVAPALVTEEGEEITEILAEVQLRTIAMDCWASLEHQLKYKQHIQKQELIEGELKRCADEIASTDMTMQTIKEMLQEEQ